MDVFWIPRAHVQDSANLRLRAKPSDELRIDTQSFHDLEVFEAQGDGPSLFELLNRTRTTGGTKVLHTRWLRPLASGDRIRDVQDSLRHITANDRAFNNLPSDGVVLAVEHYLYSGLAVVTSSKPVEVFLQSVESRVGNFRGYWKMVTCVKMTEQMLRSMQRLVDDPTLAVAPGELGARLAVARALLDRPAFHALPPEGAAELPFWRIAPIDRGLRDDERHTLEALLRIIFEIDALLSMATAVRDFRFVLPEVRDDEPSFHAEGIWHPFIKAPTPNPLHVDQQHRLLFITGPNMAGKTTYLRACGVAIYLAHLGMGVPARSFRFTPCEALFTAISLADNIRDGVSFFQAEALRLKDIALALADGLRTVALLDEPFMGTNVKDAIDASRGILTRLASREGSVFLVSSHLIELSDALLATGNVECIHFEADESADSLQFDYKVRPGVSTQRLGVRVLHEHGVFSLLDQ
jgi:DNA mismatch repair ATPase MutS